MSQFENSEIWREYADILKQADAKAKGVGRALGEGLVNVPIGVTKAVFTQAGSLLGRLGLTVATKAAESTVLPGGVISGSLGVMSGGAAAAPAVLLGGAITAAALAIGYGIYNYIINTKGDIDALIRNLENLDVTDAEESKVNGWIAVLKQLKTELEASGQGGTSTEERINNAHRQMDILQKTVDALEEIEAVWSQLKTGDWHYLGIINGDVEDAKDALDKVLANTKASLESLKQAANVQYEKYISRAQEQIKKQEGPAVEVNLEKYTALAQQILNKMKSIRPAPKFDTQKEQLGYQLALAVSNRTADANTLRQYGYLLENLNELLDKAILSLNSDKSNKFGISKRALLITKKDGTTLSVHLDEPIKPESVGSKSLKIHPPYKPLEAVQIALNNLGVTPPLVIDGQLGPNTKNAAASKGWYEEGDGPKEVVERFNATGGKPASTAAKSQDWGPEPGPGYVCNPEKNTTDMEDDELIKCMKSSVYYVGKEQNRSSLWNYMMAVHQPRNLDHALRIARNVLGAYTKDEWAPNLFNR